MPEKTLVRQASSPGPEKKYLVIHNQVHELGDYEQGEVKAIMDTAEAKLKEVLDRSDPALASGVKLGIIEIL